MDIIGEGQPAVTGQPASTAPATTAPATAQPAAQVTDPVAPAATSQPVGADVIAAVAAQAPAKSEAPAPAATDEPAKPSLYDQVRGVPLQDLLPDTLKSDPHLSRIKDIDALAKNVVDSQKFISQSVRIPGEDATEEERAAFYTKLGRPEKAEEYTLELKPEYVEKGVKVDDAQQQWYKDVALKANLTKEQANIVFESYVDKEVAAATDQQVSQTEKATKTINELKGIWRSEYNDNINLINSNLDKFFPADVQAELRSKGLFADSAFIQSMLGLTKKVTGSNMFIEGGSTANQPNTLQALEAKRRELMTSPDRRQRKTEEFELNKQIAELKSQTT